MSLFIESIKVSEGKIFNLGNHTGRFNRTRMNYFPFAPELDLGRWIKIPSEYSSGLYKCRITYGEEIEKIEFIPYVPSPVKSLKLVYDNDIEYSFKYENRFALNKLWEQKGNNDDIIIVKNEQVTDSSYSNLVFHNGKNWFTPKYPLLKGTKREILLTQGLITERIIRDHEIRTFHKAALINAMLDLGDCLVNIDHIN